MPRATSHPRGRGFGMTCHPVGAAESLDALQMESPTPRELPRSPPGEWVFRGCAICLAALHGAVPPEVSFQLPDRGYGARCWGGSRQWCLAKSIRPFPPNPVTSGVSSGDGNPGAEVTAGPVADCETLPPSVLSPLDESKRNTPLRGDGSMRMHTHACVFAHVCLHVDGEGLIQASAWWKAVGSVVTLHMGVHARAHVSSRMGLHSWNGLIAELMLVFPALPPASLCPAPGLTTGLCIAGAVPKAIAPRVLGFVADS